jgi:hypothetical protein
VSEQDPDDTSPSPNEHGALSSGEDGLTYEQLVEAMKGERALVKHFAEIKERVFELTGMPELVGRSGSSLLADAAALIGYLELLLGENEKLVAFVIGLEEAGTITRTELEFLMGLRPE